MYSQIVNKSTQTHAENYLSFHFILKWSVTPNSCTTVDTFHYIDAFRIYYACIPTAKEMKHNYVYPVIELQPCLNDRQDGWCVISYI